MPLRAGRFVSMPSAARVTVLLSNMEPGGAAKEATTLLSLVVKHFRRERVYILLLSTFETTLLMTLLL